MSFHDEQIQLRRRGKKALWAVLLLTFFFMLSEVAGGMLSGSLALLADAGHMLTDAFALSFALLAFRVSEKPPTRRMSYGFHRAEILAALANGVILVNVVVFIFLEAFKRFGSPGRIASGVMLGFAAIGLLVNLASAWILRAVKGGNLNLQGAFFHVLSDLIGSVGVLLAALVIRFFNWPYADPLAGMIIGGLIAYCAWRLLQDSVSILLEAAPRHIDLEALEKSFISVEGVRDVHDLHVWTIASGKEALSAHLDIEKTARPDAILSKVSRFLEEEFHIFHSTIQLEASSLPEHPPHF